MTSANYIYMCVRVCIYIYIYNVYSGPSEWEISSLHFAEQTHPQSS